MSKTPPSTPASFNHADPSCIGVLLANVGTPASPRVADVRRYLREFLSDRRMIELPRWLWWPLLNFVVLTVRPPKTASAYQKIWRADGSPLLAIGNQQRDRLRQRFANRTPHVQIELGMRYGAPSIADALTKLHQHGADKVLIAPLFPQYCAATTASTFDAAARALSMVRRVPALRMIDHYHDRPAYIRALADSVREYRAAHGASELLLMSFHGMPRAYFLAGDPYHCECQKTARLLAEELTLADDQWQIAFQSRVGKQAWLAPYTDDTLRELPRRGITDLQIICPGFSADCLETLEEIALLNRNIFTTAGGKRYGFIPCLNDRDDHIDCLHELIDEHLHGWNNAPDDLHARQHRAMTHGAAQ